MNKKPKKIIKKWSKHHLGNYSVDMREGIKKDVVIIGASSVGISAALRIRELNQNIKPLMIADQNSRQIIGPQILGNYQTEISKRIDIFAAAIYNQMTIENFSQLDLKLTKS
uniref:Uncharacterized protein n=1 Tax=uncultured organism TaxID=155900 RepID=M1P239_9ZZZZ|nr:hypothetical protein FLSS-26_0019 [uncultured organism]